MVITYSPRNQEINNTSRCYWDIIENTTELTYLFEDQLLMGFSRLPNLFDKPSQTKIRNANVVLYITTTDHTINHNEPTVDTHHRGKGHHKIYSTMWQYQPNLPSHPFQMLCFLAVLLTGWAEPPSVNSSHRSAKPAY